VLELTEGQPILITLSGGNPALQPLQELIELGGARGFSFALETQGSVARDWFSLLDYLVFSPKPPSSQMTWRADRFAACIEAAQSTLTTQSTLERVEELGKVGPQISLKIVVFDDADYQFAREVHAQFPALPVYLQVGNSTPALLGISASASHDEQARARIEWLLECVKRDGWLDVTILPQLHVLLWGNRRGV
jgi:7-carboxy-7-deazaguanine synthase